MTNAVARLHQSGLVHKDIKASNILIDAASGEVRLTGFGIASRLPRERQTLEPPELIAGTLSHMAPEQTGRMNRSIDSPQRPLLTRDHVLSGADRNAFRSAPTNRWSGCTATSRESRRRRKPVVEEIPPQLSAIVMKLLAKTPEERYQTAAGVERDLRRCLDDWESRGAIDEFPLGERDHSDRLMIPEKLYGRDARDRDSARRFRCRASRAAAPRLVLVSGYSGIGKSSVVNELHKVLVPPRGLFACRQVRSAEARHSVRHLGAGLSEPDPSAPRQAGGRAHRVAGAAASRR